MKGVQLTKLVQELGLHNLTPEIDLSEIVIKTAAVSYTHLDVYKRQGYTGESVSQRKNSVKLWR